MSSDDATERGVSRPPRPHPAKSSRAGGEVRLMRLRGLIRKEFIQIVRDPSSIAIAFVLPLVLLRPAKGILLCQQWKTNAHEGRQVK